MKDLFRKEALERFSSSSGMSKGIRAVNIKIALLVSMLFACTAVFTLWLAFGTIYETVSVDGIIWPAQNNGRVYARSAGTVTKTVVLPENTVSVGDILAVMPREDILAEIKEGKAGHISDTELQNLYSEYDRYSMIRSNINGVVTEIAPENSYIKEGQLIASVAPYEDQGNNKILTAFIPAKNGGLVTQGLEAQVMPNFAPREEYGYIKAYVSSVGDYPLTGRSIKEADDELFLSSMDEAQSYVRIEITLLPDAAAGSGLKWSKPDSGNLDAVMGTLCAADIIIKKCRPYEWLFQI